MLTPKQQTVYRYLRKYSIRSGEHKTPLYVLYFDYVDYCRRANFPKIVSPIEFGRRMSKFFEKGKSGRYAYYLTNVPAPKAERRRQLRMWYNRKWSRMRDDEKEKR